jgi:hypothetical protein
LPPIAKTSGKHASPNAFNSPLALDDRALDQKSRRHATIAAHFSRRVRVVHITLMLKRLLLGIVLGVVFGGVAAAALVRGLGVLEATSGAAILFMYVGAAATGALAGLFAGKPIWASGAKVEAGLKTFFGALIAAGGMFAIRQWLHVHVDLSALHAGAGAIGDLPAASLPLIGAVIAGFFEVDNTPGNTQEKGGAKTKARVSIEPKKNVRVANADVEDDQEEAASKKSLKH